jgi:signal transduction histidine kinase
MVRRWLLPTLSEILAESASTSIASLTPKVIAKRSLWEIEPLAGTDLPANKSHSVAQVQQGERQWQSAVYALGYLLQEADDDQGLLLCAPVPLFETGTYSTAIFTPVHPDQPLLTSATPVLPGLPVAPEIPLLPADPLQKERFCLVLTPQFGLVMSLSLTEAPHFQFSFDPQDIQMAWQSLRARVMLTATHQLAALDRTVESFTCTGGNCVPDYRLVTKFTQILLQHLPPEIACAPISTPAPQAAAPAPTADLELLQALTHEIRTPLTTIRTLTRSLLRRQDLAEQVVKRLESIDRECTEQINRMELIFQAVEIAEGQSVDLTTMSVSHLLEQSLPLWQQQADRRSVNLAVDMPQQLPTVLSNPTILDRVLTGLMENFTRNLPPGSHLEIEVVPVGDQIKLQVRSGLSDSSCVVDRGNTEETKAVGQLLTFRPETGNLSLNMQVTKELFQLLGGKMVVKPNQQQGETMTIFLPMNY